MSYIFARIKCYKEGQVYNMQLNFKFKAGNNEKYKVDGIWDSIVFAKESITGQLPKLNYLVLWKGYSETKNTWEPALVIQLLWRLTTIYNKNNFKKPTPIFFLIHITLPIARLITASTKKRSWAAKSITIIIIKRVKKFSISLLFDLFQLSSFIFY